MHVTDTLAFLRGSWLIDRVLDDRRSGTRGRFRGTALVTPVTGPGGRRGAAPVTGPLDGVAELSYREAGELRFGGHAGPARRRLTFRPGPGGSVAVRFADGRFFYRLDLRSGRWTAEHRCGADRYRLEHRVLGDDLLEERWLVSGPAKDYSAVTRLSRA